MDSSRAKTFQQMADELGIRHKLMYTLREASRLLRCAAYIALLFAVYALMPYVLRAMLLAADGIRVVLGMGSML